MRALLLLSFCAAVVQAAEFRAIQPTATSSFVVSTLATAPGAEARVWIRHNGEDGWRAAVPGAMLLAGSSVQTEPGSSCQLSIGARAWVHVEPGSLVTLPFSADNVDPCYRVNVERGTAWTTVAKRIAAPYFQVESRHAVGRVRGTQFKTTVTAVDTRWEMLEGRLAVARLPGGAERTLSAGTQAVVAAQSAGAAGFRTLAFAGLPAARGQFASNFGAELPDPVSATDDIKNPEVKQLPFMGHPPKTPPIKLPPGNTGVRVPPATIKLPPVKLPPGIPASSAAGTKAPGAKTLPFDPGGRSSGTPAGVRVGAGDLAGERIRTVGPGGRGVTVPAGAGDDRFAPGAGSAGFDRRLVDSGLIQVGEGGGRSRTPAAPIRDLRPARGFQPDFRRPAASPMRDFDRRLGGLDRPTGVSKFGSPVRFGR